MNTLKTPVIVILIVVLLIPIVVLFASKNDPVSTPIPTSTPTPSAAANNQSQDPADVATAHKIVLHTNKGDITLDLFPEDAPRTVKNFVTLGKRGYYNNDIFHRVIRDFVIQSGDPTGTGSGGVSIYGATFAGEISTRKYAIGSLGMARTNQPDSYGSQFFVVTDTAPSTALQALDGNYTVFGQADAASMAVVKAIATTPTGTNDKPKEDVKITGFDILAQ